MFFDRRVNEFREWCSEQHMQCVVLNYHHNPVLSYLFLWSAVRDRVEKVCSACGVWPRRYSNKGCSVSVCRYPGYQFAPVRMALCADSYHGCQPMCSTVGFVTLCMADFGGHTSGKSAECVFRVVFPMLAVSRYTVVFWTDRQTSLELTCHPPRPCYKCPDSVLITSYRRQWASVSVKTVLNPSESFRICRALF